MAESPPLVDKHSFLFKDVLKHDPVKALDFCRSLQGKWDKEYSNDKGLSLRMDKFKKTRCMHLVWVSDTFGGSLSDEISQLKTYQLLSEIYDGDMKIMPAASRPDSNPTHSHAEKDRKGEQQLKQHLFALLHVFKAAERKDPLSEKLIKDVHHILMKDLVTGSGDCKINAGEYRQCAVGTGMTHTYPDPDCVSSTMTRIVREYEDKFNDPNHHPMHIAAWLLFELLSIHPFEDGNGRVSRLCWCYSLLRDGLPFPVTPFPEHKKAYKMYIRCINQDRSISLSSECKHLTSLTLISITTTWKNFLVNLRNEISPERYMEIVTWLKESGNSLE